MKIKSIFAFFAIIFSCLSFNSAFAQTSQQITVFAPSSLTNALQEIGTRYTQRYGTQVRFSFASSSVIARQIENGAPTDIFISADTEWMDYLQTKGLLQNQTRSNLLRGRLALIAPNESHINLRIRHRMSFANALGSNGRLAIGDPDTVPAGKYAKSALQYYNAWDGVSGRIARGENVRAALAFVARGEAPVGIVYETDAKIETRVKIIGIFPEASHPPILYPIAITKTANSNSRNFYNYLKSSDARTIFRNYGFINQ